MPTFRIAAIPGDGIGMEVMPEGLRVLDEAARKFGISLQIDHFDFASCDYYLKHGDMLPADWKEKIGGHDAIFLAQWAGRPRFLIMCRSGVRCLNFGVNLISM